MRAGSLVISQEQVVPVLRREQLSLPKVMIKREACLHKLAFWARDKMADRQSRAALDAQPERTMRVLWVMFVVAIGVVLIAAIYLWSVPFGPEVRTNENATQASHSSKTGSAFDK
jgi:hypothetical protein